MFGVATPPRMPEHPYHYCPHRQREVIGFFLADTLTTSAADTISLNRAGRYRTSELGLWTKSASQYLLIVY
jgi:hypothetical protein